MNYNERTGVFGKPKYYSYGNAPALVTHFDGITAVPGGFNLVAISSAQAASMAFIPATGGNWPSFGTARWYPVNVAASSLCSGGCSIVTGNTVYQNQVMGLYVRRLTRHLPAPTSPPSPRRDDDRAWYSSPQATEGSRCHSSLIDSEIPAAMISRSGMAAGRRRAR